MRLVALASVASERERIVPGNDETSPEDTYHGSRRSNRQPSDSPRQDVPRRRRAERCSWAVPLRRAFLIDVRTGSRGARRRVSNPVCDPAKITRLPTHLGLPTDPPDRAPPPVVQRAMEFG